MKKIVLFATLFIGVTAFGQLESKKITEKESAIVGSNKGNTGVEMMITELNLTSEQTIQVNELLEKRQDELANAKDSKASSNTDAINKKYEKEFRAILTPEQRKKLDAKQQDVQLEKKSPKKLQSTKVKAVKSN